MSVHSGRSTTTDLLPWRRAIPWPSGLFRGVFDPLDLAAYAGDLAARYALDRWQSDTDVAR